MSATYTDGQKVVVEIDPLSLHTDGQNRMGDNLNMNRFGVTNTPFMLQMPMFGTSVYNRIWLDCNGQSLNITNCKVTMNPDCTTTAVVWFLECAGTTIYTNAIVTGTNTGANLATNYIIEATNRYAFDTPSNIGTNFTANITGIR